LSSPDEPTEPTEPGEPGRPGELEAARRRRRAAEVLKKTNREPAMLRALRTAREMLPGDPTLGDGPSITGDRPSDVIANYLTERNEAGSTVGREAGLAAIQIWQALSERTAGGSREVSATILFTDLVGFSDWVLAAGDEAALELLRAVARVVEPAIKGHRGRIVKYLGDGHMAVFGDPRAGVDAALAIQDDLESVEVRGHCPRLRAGLHLGTPQRVGRDFLGTDVNVAARVGAAAGAGEVLVSGALVNEIDTSGLALKRKRGFRAKGTPSDMQVFSVRRAATAG
jgi:adenylate cyclase